MPIPELFTGFYRTTHHGTLRPWIRTSIAMSVAATGMLSSQAIRNRERFLPQPLRQRRVHCFQRLRHIGLGVRRR